MHVALHFQVPLTRHCGGVMHVRPVFGTFVDTKKCNMSAYPYLHGFISILWAVTNLKRIFSQVETVGTCEGLMVIIMMNNWQGLSRSWCFWLRRIILPRAGSSTSHPDYPTPGRTIDFQSLGVFELVGGGRLTQIIQVRKSPSGSSRSPARSSCVLF